MDKGRLLVISGPSGAGKGTICRNLLEDMDSLVFSVSLTTRKARKGETDGKEYYFITKEEFQRRLDEDDLMEYANVYGEYYGTPKSKVMELIDKGIDVVLEIDIQGAMSIKKKYSEAVFIFILPPSMGELRKRITGRGTESEKSIAVRLEEAVNEIDYIEKYDYCVINENLVEAVERVKAIVVAEHSKVTQDVVQLIKRYKEEI